MRRTATRIRLLLSASVLLVVVGAYPAAAAASPTGGPDGQGLAAFEWDRLSQVNTSVSGERLWSLRGDGFGAVYADVGEWLEAADQPESWSQRRRLRRLTGDLRRFVARASSQGLAVHAVAGGPGWTADSHRYLGPTVLELVADYNADADPDERLQGVQSTSSRTWTRASGTTWRSPSRRTSGRSRASWTPTRRRGPSPATRAWASGSPSRSGTTGHRRCRRSSSG